MPKYISCFNTSIYVYCGIELKRRRSFVFHFQTYDLHISGLYNSFVVIPTIVQFPVFLVDIKLETVLGGEFLGVDTVNPLHTKIERVTAIILSAYLF